MSYCSVCKAVDGTHFVRNLISDVAHQDHNSIMSDWHERAHRLDLYLDAFFSCFLTHHQENI